MSAVVTINDLRKQGREKRPRPDREVADKPRWSAEKPTVAGTYLIYCPEWKSKLNVVDVIDEEGIAYVVQSSILGPTWYGNRFQTTSLEGFNSLAKRRVYWQRVEVPS